MLRTDGMSFVDGNGFFSSAFGFTGSVAGFTFNFGSSFTSTFGFWFIDVSRDLLTAFWVLDDG